MKKICLKWVLAGLLIISLTLMLPAFSRAQSYPGKDISWIVSSEPGGGFDTYARAVSPYLEKYLPNKVNVVVKNITGGGGLKGASSIFNAKPDGYTIGYIYYPGIAIIQMTSDIGFDFTRLTPIAQIAVDIQGLFVSAKSDIKTLADLQKKNPLRILTQPKGVTMYSFCTIAGKVLNLKYKLVTGYKGGNEVATGIMRGDGDAGVLNLSEFIKYVKSEDLRVILTFSEKRDTLTPNVPSVKELGFPEATAINSWKVLFGPPSLPPDITKTLQTAFQKALEDPGLKAWADKAERALEFKDGESSWKELQTIVPIYKKYE